MKSLVEKLREATLGLMFSLPRNSVDTAKTALDAGADVLKVHINVEHRASGTYFGTLDEERTKLEGILQVADDTIPVGIVPRGQGIISPNDVMQLRDMGFSFISAYAHTLSPAVLSVPGIEKMVAPDNSYDVAFGRHWKELGVDVIEASIIEAAGYGEPLNLRDISRYALWLEHGLPIVVPSQRVITIDDADLLRTIGVAGLLLGAVVTGTSDAEISEQLRKFHTQLNATKRS